MVFCMAIFVEFSPSLHVHVHAHVSVCASSLVYVYKCMCFCGCVHLCLCTQVPDLDADVFLAHSPSYFLRQGLSVSVPGAH